MRDQPRRPGKSVMWALVAVLLAALVGAGGLLVSIRPLEAGPGRAGPVVEAYRPDNLVRLHVLANSDRPEDQALKLRVRDEVLRFLSPRWEGVQEREQALEVIRQNRTQLAALLEEVVAASGEQYGVRLEIGDFPFPERTYGSLTVPAGVYPALRVVLGEGKGHNWWCVLFPPLCFLDARVGTSLKIDPDPLSLAVQRMATDRPNPMADWTVGVAGRPVQVGDLPVQMAERPVQVRLWILDWLRRKGLDADLWVHRGEPRVRPDGM